MRPPMIALSARAASTHPVRFTPARTRLAMSVTSLPSVACAGSQRSSAHDPGCRKTAVDTDGLPRDEARTPLVEQKCRRTRDLIRGPVTALRDRTHPCRADLLRVHFLHHGRLDRPRRNRIDPDP